MNSKKRALIKKDAQSIKAKIQIGAAELHDNVYKSIEQMFNNNEIIKIKVNRADKENKAITRDLANEIITKVNCELVDIIGTTIILYKEHSDPDMRVDYDR